FIGGILDRFEAAVPHVLAGIKAVEDLVQTMERHVKRLGDLLGEVVDGAAPITDALDRFVKELLGYLPFGIGDRIQQVVQEMSDLIALLPAGVQLVSERLISP